MLYHMSYSFLLHERDLWLRKLLTYPIPPVKCLSLAGTQLIFKTQFHHMREAHCLLICASPFFADRTYALPFTVLADKFVWTGTRHNPLAFEIPGSLAANR